jgi:hypothetical protein
LDEVTGGGSWRKLHRETLNDFVIFAKYYPSDTLILRKLKKYCNKFSITAKYVSCWEEGPTDFAELLELPQNSERHKGKVK